MRNKIISASLLLFVMAFAPFRSNAQKKPFSDYTSTKSPSGPTPVDTPIDGGLSLLLAAGLAYGVRKRRHDKRQSALQDKEN